MRKFTGFDGPEQNWSKLPHQLIDALHLIETMGELKVILYVLRHTWGYQDQEKKITLDEFAHGRKKGRRKDDITRIDKGTGMSKPSLRDGIARAIEHGFLNVETDDSDKARIKKIYSLNRGERNLAPEVKKLYPRSNEDLPRTEKETIDKKPEKETPDPLQDVLHYRKEGVKESTASNPDDQWLQYGSKIKREYRNATNAKLNETQKGLLGALTGEEGFDWGMFKKYLDEFAGCGGYAYDMQAFVKGYWVYQKTGDIYQAMGKEWLSKRQDENTSPPTELTAEKHAILMELNKRG